MGYKKKEIIIIVLIILLTLGLAFSSKIEGLFIGDDTLEVDDDKEKERKRYVKLTITGELVVDKLILDVPYGYSYGNIISILEKYTNDYSIIDYDSTQRFIDDTSIFIETRDNKSLTEDEDSDGININTAGKSDLIKLYGIGEKRADKIIEYRKTKLVESFEELKKLIGVSDEVIEAIKGQAVL